MNIKNHLINENIFALLPKGANIGSTSSMSPNTLSYVVLSQGVIRDATTFTPSYTNIFDSFAIPSGKEETIESFFVSGRILNTNGGFTKVEVVIIDPSGKSLYTDEASGTVSAGDFNFSINFKLKSFVAAGKYQIKVKVNNVMCEDNDKYYFFVKKL